MIDIQESYVDRADPIFSRSNRDTMTAIMTNRPAEIDLNARLLLLPVEHGDSFAMIGPAPAEAALAVDPFLTLDIGRRTRTILGAMPAGAGAITQLVEFSTLPEHARGASTDPLALEPAQTDQPDDTLSPPAAAAPIQTVTLLTRRQRELPVLAYCRKRNGLIAARAANGALLPATRDHDHLIESQRAFLAATSPVLDQAPHLCVRCEERTRCYPADDGYAYAADRLLLVNAQTRLDAVRPLGEWQLTEAADWIAGRAPEDIHDERLGPLNGWRTARWRELARAAPRLLLVGEPYGRDLVEILRLKLRLVVGALVELEHDWSRSGRPLLRWNDDSIRVVLTATGSLPAFAWGATPLLRAPATDDRYAEQAADRVWPYPKCSTEDWPYPAEVAEAARLIGQTRSCQLVVKSTRAGSSSPGAACLLEDFGVPHAWISAADRFVVEGEEWSAVLTPSGAHDPADGAGIAGLVRLPRPAKTGDVLGPLRGRWYPGFGQGTDVAALGALLLDALVSNDAHPPAPRRHMLERELAELTTKCRAVDSGHAGNQAQAWLSQRGVDDAPANLWSRRALLYRAAERDRARLEDFPPALWLAALSVAVRMATFIPGWSYCSNRAAEAPRMGGASLPRLELEGLIASCDDVIFRRTV